MIRIAKPSDLSDISRLSQILQKMHADNFPAFFKSEPDDAAFCAWFKDVIEEPESLVLVAMDSDTMVGYLYAQEERKSESWVTRDYHRFLLHHIVVDPLFRNKHYGRELMARFLKDADQRGIENAELDVWDFNDKARIFFAGYGFKPTSMRMRVGVQS